MEANREVQKDPLSLTAVIIEDDTQFQELLQAILEKEGFRVYCARNGREGIDLLETVHRPDIVFLDIMMPVLDGHSVIEEVAYHKELSQSRIVLMSSLPSNNFYPHKANATFLQKPIEPQALMNEIQAVQNKARSQPAAQ